MNARPSAKPSATLMSACPITARYRWLLRAPNALSTPYSARRAVPRARQFRDDGDVLQRRERGEQIEILKDETELPQANIGQAILGQRAEGGAVQLDRPFGRFQECAEH